MQPIKEEDDVPTAATKPQPEKGWDFYRFKTSEKAARNAEESKVSDKAAAKESKVSDTAAAKESKVSDTAAAKESKVSDTAAAKESKISDKAAAEEFKYEELKSSAKAVSGEFKPKEEFKAVSGEFKTEEEFKAVSGEFKTEEEFKAVSGEFKTEEEFKAVSGEFKTEVEFKAVSGEFKTEEEFKAVSGESKLKEELKALSGESKTEEFKAVSGESKLKEEFKAVSGESKLKEELKALSGESKTEEEFKAVSGESKPEEEFKAVSGESKPEEEFKVVSGESKPEKEFKAVSGESKPEKEFKAVSWESKSEEEFKVVSGESESEEEFEAVSGEPKPEEEFEAVSGESKPEEDFEAVSGESKPEEEFKASGEAVNFLTSIEPEELQKCVFSETLVVMSDCGGVLGEFSVSVEFTHRDLEPCVILHARSHGAIDGSPCGTTVTTYLTADLEVLEEDYHEYVKLDSYNVEKRCHMVQRDGQMVISKFTSMGEDVTEEECVSYPMSVLRGLVTEGSSMLLMRLMALRKKVPKNMVFIILDQSLHINQTTFSELDVKKIQTHGETVEVFGLERMVGSADADHSTWHCYFLDNGHLASRKQVGSPVTMKFIQELSKKDKGHVKVPLVWHEDMQLYSLYLDKKDSLKAEHNSYLREHPELRALLSDFIQDLLIVKPDNIFQFAREYFPPYSTYHSPQSDLKTPSP